MADDKQGIVHNIKNILQLDICKLPIWNSISLGMIIQANTEAYKRPTVQNADKIIMRGLRYLWEKNSEKYENITGIDPPTL